MDDLKKIVEGIKALKKKGVELGKNLACTNKKLNECIIRVQLAEKRLKKINPSQSEEYMKGIEEDARHLHRYFDVLISKVALMTELRYMLREDDSLSGVLMGYSIAFDYSDEFWKRRENISLHEWQQICLIIRDKSEKVAIRELDLVKALEG